MKAAYASDKLTVLFNNSSSSTHKDDDDGVTDPNIVTIIFDVTNHKIVSVSVTHASTQASLDGAGTVNGSPLPARIP